MSRLVKKSPSVCTDLPLNTTDLCSKLQLMKELLRSSYGPTGRLKQVHNNIGGSVVTSSASSVLLQAISSSQPIINLIKTSILGHIHRFSDCGLFAAVFCLSLIEEAKQGGLRENVVIRVNNHLLTLCTDYLQQEDCSCKVRLDFCSSQSLITLARSVLSSKPTCVLTEPELAHISRLAVQAFLLTVPCNIPETVTLGRTVTVPLEGHSVLESAVFPGLLLDMPENLGPVHLCSPLCMVLFSASLAGDLSELGDGKIEMHSGVDTDSQILDQLLQLGKQVLNDEVKLFVCQKVIHPVLQHYLRCNGLIVIERLGVSLMEPLIQLTGAQPVATLHTNIPSTAYGRVHKVGIKQFGSKKMVHLQPAGETAVCSMILCHRNETMLNELKLVCQKTEHVLRLTLREPCALLGGGCTETHLAAYIRHKSNNEISKSSSVLGCSQTEYRLVAEAFCRSLELVAMALEHDGGSSLIDLTHAHHWILPSDATEEQPKGVMGLCGCGAVESCQNKKWSYLSTKYAEFSPAPLQTASPLQPTVLDSFTAKMNAFRVAVETANLVLDVRYVIQDFN
ncbi:PREDICTED: McKusick-Kaufman/Bardet-Biedl syndromes putative chaperonin [Cyprinodon variegatus]|uniref:MKKS centrosomal shuttling protein n=1 Tax=Cyprinodon variegatus TaxID=28743 RepID=A0A3Q2D4N1_CYPVA|nr:PREDICTED: McKusick-Kaufman/Bardet-Biedl syndromes putative chaperonin [Cyprinodon variegatus]